MARKAAVYLTPIVFTIILVVVIIQFQKKENVDDEDYTKRKGYKEFSNVDDRFIKELSFTGNNKTAEKVAKEIKKKTLDLINGDSYWRKLDINDSNSYCHLKQSDEHKYLVVLLYIPGITEYSEDEQKKFSASLWSSLQVDADKIFEGYPTICLGLRDKKEYGLISVGGKNRPPSKEIGGEPFYQAFNKEHIFYPFFKKEEKNVQANNLKAKHKGNLQVTQ